MMESGRIRSNLVATGIALVATGPVCSVAVILGDSFHSFDVGFLVAFQVLIAVSYLILAAAYRSWLRSLQPSAGGISATGPLRIFAAANLAFALAYLVSSADYLHQQLSHGFEGWALVLWLIGQSLSCVGFAMATVGLWLSARAPGADEMADEEPGAMPAEVVAHRV